MKNYSHSGLCAAKV